MNSDAIARLQTLRVRDVMNRAVVNLSASQPMAEVADTFARHQVSSAPVVDEQGRCVGILSAVDFIDRELAHGGGSSATPAGEEKSLTSAPQGGSIQIVPGLEDAAANYMSKGVQSIASDAPLLTAAKMMCAEHIHRLPVLDEAERPVGMISTMDIVAALLGAIDEMRSAKH